MKFDQDNNFGKPNSTLGFVVFLPNVWLRGAGVNGFLNNIKKSSESGHPLPVSEAEGGEPEEERPKEQKNQDKNVWFLK